MKPLLWALKNLFRGLRGLEGALLDIAKCQKRALELQEMALMLQYGAKKGGLMTLGVGEPGGESIHWASEGEELKREEWKRAYEDMFGVKLGPLELPPSTFLEEMAKMGDTEAPL